MAAALKPRNVERPRWARWILGVIAAIGLLFLLAPLVVLAARGLLGGGWSRLPETGVREAVALSLLTTSLTAVVTVVFGTPLAYVLARWRFPGRRLAVILVELPIVLPPAVAGLALLMTFGRRGALGPLLGAFGVSLPFTTAAVVMAQIFVSAPFFIRAAQVGFAGVSREIEDAAKVDGAGGFTLFRTVTLPLARRALAAGLVLSWARAAGEFGATILFAGSLQGRTQTMPLLIYNVLERDLEAAVITGLLLVGLALVALALSQWLARHENENALPA